MGEEKNKLKSTARIKPKSGKESEIIVHTKFVEEDLPLPFVFYPDHYGTFIGFASSPNSTVYLCSCAKPAIDNYVRLMERIPKGTYSDRLIMAPLSSHEFPRLIAEQSQHHQNTDHFGLTFKNKICHRCNLATPTVRHCHEMYGGRFRQYYGWYIGQKRLQLGIKHNESLNEVCPEEIQKQLKQINEVSAKANGLRKVINDRFGDSLVSFRPTREEWLELNALDKEASKLGRSLSNIVENQVRQEFGFRNVGDGWISESILFKIVQRLYKSENVIRHYRPNWLNGMELDIFIPSINLAFEYQGQQHYHSVKAWGGERSLKAVQARDKLKKSICEERETKLIAVDYTEPLTELHIKHLIESAYCG